MTSPVLFISGPSTGSAPGNLSNGSNTSFTDTQFTSRSSRYSSSASVAPAMTFAAIFAMGTPTALDTNGMVRLERGFASRT